MEGIKEIQLYIEGTKPEPSSCAFSGHRILGEDFDVKRLEDAVRECIKKGVKRFYCGMAAGFDLAAAECVLALKKEYGAALIACIPCENQEKNFSPSDKERYARILRECDEKILLSDKYYRWCMLKRNEYMEKNSDMLICYCRKETGGSAYTLKLFKRRNKPVIEL